MNNNLEYIKTVTSKLINGCVAETDGGIRLFKPDGMGRYQAVWTRDFAYMVEYAGELMNKDDIYFNLKYLMDHASPEGWIPDRVQPDGYVSYRIDREECPQGPNLDNGPFLIIAADAYLKMLEETDAKKSFLEWKDTLCRGIDWLPLNSNGLITVAENDLHVGYGFTDTVNKTGELSKETLLLWKAAKMLSKWLRLCGLNADKYDCLIQKIEESFCETFSDESGMLLSATGKCHQIDVWASCYMISINFPASEEQKAKIAQWLISNYDGVVEDGQIRHLPAGEYWESLYIDIEKNTYQNGSFWPVATGWFFDAIKNYDMELATKTVLNVLEYFKTHGVYECVCGEYKKLDTYVVSATNVYYAVKQMAGI